MRKLKRLWMPTLLGMLLIATVAGVASARPTVTPAEQAWRVLAVPAAAFGPSSNDEGWWGKGGNIACSNHPYCNFAAPVYFPAAGEQAVGAVSVKRLTLYGTDGWASVYDSCVTLHKKYPPGGGDVIMASVCTDYSPSLAAWMDTTIDNNPVYRVHAPYLTLSLWAYDIGAPMHVTGIFIHYTWL